MKANAILIKVDIDQLISTMVELWDYGVDYIDIEVSSNNNTMTLSYIEEYLSNDFEYDDDDCDLLEMDDERENVRIYKKHIEIQKDLTEEDLEELM